MILSSRGEPERAAHLLICHCMGFVTHKTSFTQANSQDSSVSEVTYYIK